VLPDPPPPPPAPGDAVRAVRGSCACGRVRYRLAGEPTTARFCHYSRCRKARAAGHAANLMAAIDAVRFSEGAGEIATWRVPGARFFAHAFCRHCGGSVPRLDREREVAIAPMGGLDDDPGVRPVCHIFAGSRARWDEIRDGLPGYDEGLPA